MDTKRWRIEVSGTHSEGLHRPFDKIVSNLLVALPSAGYHVEELSAEFDVPPVEAGPEPEPLEPQPPRRVLGLSLFDPRGLTGRAVKERVADINDIPVLEAGAGLERLHTRYDGGRVKVLGYIESRIQQIIG